MVLLFLVQDCILILYLLPWGFYLDELSHDTGLGSLFSRESSSLFFFQLNIYFCPFEDVHLQPLKVMLHIHMFSSLECCALSLKLFGFFTFVSGGNLCCTQVNCFRIYFCLHCINNAFVSFTLPLSGSIQNWWF